MPRRQVIRTCSACGGCLLAEDFVGRAVGLMDRALAFHTSMACSSESHAIQAIAEQLKAVVDEVDGGTKRNLHALPWPDEQHPLSFCARHGLNDLGLRLLSSGLVERDQLECTHLGGLSPLHRAASSDRSLPLLEALLHAGASPRARSQDGTTKADAGGRTPLHVAAQHGACLAVRRLLVACPVVAAVADWDGCYPAQAAWIRGHAALALELAQAAEAVADAAEEEARAVDPSRTDAEREEEAEQLRAMVRAVRAAGGVCEPREAAVQRSLLEMTYVERERERLTLAGRRRLQAVHLVRGLFTPSECEWLLGQLQQAAAYYGWQHARHKHYATEDVPVWRAPAAASFVFERMASVLGPTMSSCFGVPDTALRLHECFGVRYEPAGQPALAMHRDGTMFSFNVTLNDASSFAGGGTCFNTPTQLCTWPSAEAARRQQEVGVDAMSAAETTVTTLVRGGQGDCLLHCGQLLHGGCTVSEGVRFILVGFVAEWWQAD